MKISVLNLSRKMTETQLYDLFATHGAIAECTLVLDAETGKSKGFGFIDMPHVGDAYIAIANLNGKRVQGNRIKVKKTG